jgi:hypothetical protein
MSGRMNWDRIKKDRLLRNNSFKPQNPTKNQIAYFKILISKCHKAGKTNLCNFYKDNFPKTKKSISFEIDKIKSELKK